MKQFKKIYVEITNVCNLNCNFCPKTKRELRFMDQYAFKHIINEIRPYTKNIYFHLMGEPLLNPQLGKFLQLSREMGFNVKLTTNGTLISGNKDMLLSSQALRQVNISLSSHEANCTSISLENYMNGIIDFLLHCDKVSDKTCTLRLWNLDNGDVKGSNTKNTYILEMLQKELMLDFDLIQELSNYNNVRLKNKTYLNMAKKFEWPDINKFNSEEKVFCYGLRDQIGILVDGTVVPCCLDSDGNIPLGNIFETELKDILSSDRAVNLYQGFSQRYAAEELCRKCGYAGRFSK